MPLNYDRRVPEPLLAELGPAGAAESLVDYGRSGQFALDLQLRGYADKADRWATLYVGLTKVLDIKYKASGGGRFSLDVHKTYQEGNHGWDPAWATWMSADKLRARWPQVETYLETVIPRIGARFLKEGTVQSAMSGFASHDLVVIDREAAITFTNQKEKDAVTRELAAPLLDAIAQSNGMAWWNSAPTSLGGECDALAISRTGELLAIEVKPANQTSSIPWAAVQVRHYANLFQRWIDENPARANEVLLGMFEQRRQLGLVDGSIQPKLAQPLRVHPVLAIGRNPSLVALARLAEVQARLVDTGQNDPPLRVFQTNLTGRLRALLMAD